MGDSGVEIGGLPLPVESQRSGFFHMPNGLKLTLLGDNPYLESDRLLLESRRQADAGSSDSEDDNDEDVDYSDYEEDDGDDDDTDLIAALEQRRLLVKLQDQVQRRKERRDQTLSGAGFVGGYAPSQNT